MEIGNGTDPHVKNPVAIARAVTHEQKVRVFRSIVKAARLHNSSVELNLYLNPVQNYQWKYRQQLKPSAQRAGFLESLQVQFFPGIHTSAPSRYHLTE